MSYKAIHKFAHISAQKVRPFADIIRGQYALEAVDALKFFPNRGARMLEKVLNRRVDLVEEGCLIPSAAESANRDKILIYEREN